MPQASPYDYNERSKEDSRVLARAFVAKVREMNAEMSLPATVAKMTPADVAAVATRALEEAHGEQWYNLLDIGYPVPCYMRYRDCLAVVRALLPPSEGPPPLVARL